MEFNDRLFSLIADDLEKNYQAKVTLVATINDEVDYTIIVGFPNGKKWEIVDIREEKK